MKEVLQVVQALVTISAIVIGGIWSYILFFAQRESAPKLTIDHAIEARAIHPDYTWIHLSVELENRGKTRIQLATADIRIQRILPLPKAISEAIEEGRDPVTGAGSVVPWSLLCRHTPELRFEIEPNEISHVTQEFILPASVRVVKVYSYFENARKSAGGASIGWPKTTIYTIPQDREAVHAKQTPPETPPSIERLCRVDR